MLYFDHFSILCTNECCSVVTIAEVVAGLTGSFFYQCFAYCRFGIHGNQCLHTVSTMYIQCLSYRAKAMSSVYIAPVFHIVVQAPA